MRRGLTDKDWGGKGERDDSESTQTRRKGKEDDDALGMSCSFRGLWQRVKS